MAREGPTEEILERARDLDERSVGEIVRLIHEEDAIALAAVGEVLGEIESAVDILEATLAGGGTWINIGAGTSGRIGVLDASEIPPTFGLSPRRVQAVIAGGDKALRVAVEGAEDNFEAGSWELRERGPSEWVTPWSPSRPAAPHPTCSVRSRRPTKSVPAASAFPATRIRPWPRPSRSRSHPEVGPEVIAGSTRMKGGLVQKMICTLLSTAVMVKLGRVQGNLMTNLSCPPIRNSKSEPLGRILMRAH